MERFCSHFARQSGCVFLFRHSDAIVPASRRTAIIFSSLRYRHRPFSADQKIGVLYRAWIIPTIMVVIGSIVVGLSAHFWSMVLAGVVYRIGVRNVVISSMLLDGKHDLYSDLHHATICGS